MALGKLFQFKQPQPEPVVEAPKEEKAHEPIPRVRVEFERLIFAGNNTILHLRLFTDDMPTTVFDFQLHGENGELLGKSHAAYFGFPEATGFVPSLRLDAAHSTKGFLQFGSAGNPKQKWQLSYRDHTGHRHKVVVTV